MKSVKELLLWGGVGILGAFSLATVALNRGESINAVWLFCRSSSSLTTLFINSSFCNLSIVFVFCWLFFVSLGAESNRVALFPKGRR